ncbi:MAG: hypothetical protein AAGA56_22995, partial [Myxococcota bacterium]
TAGTSTGTDDGPRFLCTVPDLESVGAGQFVGEAEEGGQTEALEGEAVYGFVEAAAQTWFVLSFGLGTGSTYRTITLWEARDDLPAAGSLESSALGPFKASIESSRRTFGGPGTTELTVSVEGDVQGTFSFGLLTDPGESDTASACGAFKATFSDELTADDLVDAFP